MYDRLAPLYDSHLGLLALEGDDVEARLREYLENLK